MARRNSLLYACAALLSVSLLLHAAASFAAQQNKTLKLYGEIDELSYMCSSAGLSLSGKGPPYTVAHVSLGSAASYSGVRAGDKLLHLSTAGDGITVTIERNGKQYQTSIATDVQGLKQQFEKRGVAWGPPPGAFDKELKQLNNCKLIVLLDASKSMNENHAGCPGDLTKWMWCKQQLDNLYYATARVLDGGFDVMPFSSGFQRYNGVTLYDLRSLYDRTQPNGGAKDMEKPLQTVIDDFIREGEKKPTIVMVLTDGTENQGGPLETVLIDASKRIKNPGRFSVVFLPVGNSQFADSLFEDLDRNLIAKGAKYKIASSHSFSEFANKGVLYELVLTIQNMAKNGSTVNPTF